MPTYEYYCHCCDYVFEIENLMKDMKIQEPCPECKELADKQFTIPTPLIFNTVGSLAEKNSNTMSQEEKHLLTEKYKSNQKNNPFRWHKRNPDEKKVRRYH